MRYRPFPRITRARMVADPLVYWPLPGSWEDVRFNRLLDRCNLRYRSRVGEIRWRIVMGLGSAGRYPSPALAECCAPKWEMGW